MLQSIHRPFCAQKVSSTERPPLPKDPLYSETPPFSLPKTPQLLRPLADPLTQGQPSHVSQRAPPTSYTTTPGDATLVFHTSCSSPYSPNSPTASEICPPKPAQAPEDHLRTLEELHKGQQPLARPRAGAVAVDDWLYVLRPADPC